MEIKGNTMPRSPNPPVKFRNKNNYYEYHGDYGHTTSECRELKKVLYELADQEQSTLS